MSVKIKTPFRYIGGKSRWCKIITALFPPHKLYVEAFGGSGAVLLNKARSMFEVYNDVDLCISVFFRVFRERGAELVERLRRTPRSRLEFELAERILEDWRRRALAGAVRFEEVDVGSDEAMVLAWAVVVYYQMSFGGRGRWFAVERALARPPSLAQYWANHVEGLPELAKRLRSVTIECLSYERLFATYDGPDTLFYCDPPYVGHTRTGHDKAYYGADMQSEGEHAEFVTRILALRGKCIVSGYEHPLYEPLERAGWRVILFDRDNALARRGARASVRKREALWLNYEPPAVDWSRLTSLTVIHKQHSNAVLNLWGQPEGFNAPIESSA